MGILTAERLLLVVLWRLMLDTARLPRHHLLNLLHQARAAHPGIMVRGMGCARMMLSGDPLETDRQHLIAMVMGMSGIVSYTTNLAARH